MKKRIAEIVLILFVVLTTVAYSALATSLAITSEAKFRVQANIRVTNIHLQNTSNATLQYESNYTKDRITSGFKLTSTDSRITYAVTVKNSGNIDQTIYGISTVSSNNSGLSFELSGYTEKDIIEYPSEITFYITYKTSTPSNEVINVVNYFDFREVYEVRYETNGGKNIEKGYKYKDIDLTLPEGEKEGYTFTGWTDEQNGTTAKYTDSYTLNNSVLLYAIYTANELNFTNQTLDQGTYGTAYTSNAFTGASNGTGDYTYSIKSGAPTGATIDSSNRKISIPNTVNAATYNIVVTAKDNNTNKTKDATMKIIINRAKPTITPASTSKALTYPTAGTVTYTYDGDGEVSCTSGDTSYVQQQKQ